MLVLIGALFAMVSCRKDPLPPSPEDPEVFAACVIPGTPATLDIATFNVEGFPKNGHISVVALASLLKAMDVDVIALRRWPPKPTSTG